TAQKIASAIESGDLKGFNETAKNLLDEHDSVTVVSAALKLLTKERKNVPVRISSVQPISVKGGRGGGRDGKRHNKGGEKGFIINEIQAPKGINAVKDINQNNIVEDKIMADSVKRI